MMTITNKVYEAQKSKWQAAELAALFEDACKNFFDDKTPENAEDIIDLGEKLLKAQNEVGTQFRKPDSIRHRIFTAQDYLDQNPKGSSRDTFMEGHKTYKMEKGERIRVIKL